MWALVRGAEISHTRKAVYISAENPLKVNLQRLRRLDVKPEGLLFFQDPEIDLRRSEDIAWLIEVSQDAALVILDTLTSVWGGNGLDNDEIAEFDRTVLQPLVRETGATVVVLDHTGHTQLFVKREGISAGRGASAKGQKADVVLHFTSEEGTRFTIIHGKNRFGAKRPPQAFEVVDTPDGNLDIIAVEGLQEAKVTQLADAILTALEKAGDGLTTKEVRTALMGIAGKELQGAAMAMLRAEDPARVSINSETRNGSRANVWRVVPTLSAGYPGQRQGVGEVVLGAAPIGAPGHPDTLEAAGGTASEVVRPLSLRQTR
jgi:hypothetical protein